MIAFALRQADAGTPIVEVFQKDGRLGADVVLVEEAVRTRGGEELRRLKQLEEENRELKSLVADLSLNKAILQDGLRGTRK